MLRDRPVLMWAIHSAISFAGGAVCILFSSSHHREPLEFTAPLFFFWGVATAIVAVISVFLPNKKRSEMRGFEPVILRDPREPK